MSSAIIIDNYSSNTVTIVVCKNNNSGIPAVTDEFDHVVCLAHSRTEIKNGSCICAINVGTGQVRSEQTVEPNAELVEAHWHCVIT